VNVERWGLNKRKDWFPLRCGVIKILKIRWVDKVTNAEVCRKIGENGSLWKMLTKRRDELIGHTLQYEGLLKTSIEGLCRREEM
jgi:hypothetical protein